jgi:phage/plasmid-associated DNA primase
LEKAFYCCIDGTDNGKGDNGKTLFFEILTMLFPCYVYKSDCSLIENDNKKAHKQLVRTKGKRLVWVDEYKQNKKADYTLLKQLAEGKTKENEVMFGTTETLKFMFKLFVLSNHKFTIPAVEEAVYNRYNEIPYTSHFDRTGAITTPNPNALEFIADVTLLDNIVNNYKNEVAGLIIEYGHKYYVNKLPSIPAFFKTKTMETRRHNDSFIEWFEDNCETSAGAKVALKIMLHTYGKGEAELKDGMKRLGYKYNKELKGVGKDESGKYYKGGYEGVKIKEVEKNENTEEP